MCPIRRIDDLDKQNRDRGDDPDRPVESFAGGEKSGLAIQQPDKEGVIKVFLYQDGFQIEGSEFRPFSEAANAEFMQKLKSGEAPSELKKLVSPHSGQLQVMLVDKSNTEYQRTSIRRPQQPAVNLFSGTGHSLSSSASGGAQTPSVDPARVVLHVDPTRPTTTLSFRFHDGTRHVQAFNTQATIQDLSSYVAKVAPLPNFTLLIGFPPHAISANPETTLAEAQLINETVTQRPV